MESGAPGPSKGYQKAIKKEEVKAPPKPKGSVDYSSPMAKKWPLFIEAINNGKVEVVKQIIDEGLNVNTVRDGVTPLMLAASKGNAEIADAILQAGVNINERNDDGWTALHKAANDQAGAAIVDLLLQSGIDVEAKNKAGKTALQLAEETRHRDIVLLIKKYQHQLRVDAQEWEEFLNTSEGKPYKLSKQYDAMARYFKLWWVPLAALGGGGLLLGILFSRIVMAGGIGILAGLLVSIPLLFREKKLRAYLDDIGPLPALNIHTLRAKRNAGESLALVKQSDAPLAQEAVSGVPVNVTQESGSMHSELETIPELGPVEEISYADSRSNKERNRRIISYAVVVLVVLILGSALAMYKDPLVRLFYAKRLERTGIAFSEQSFLEEVSKGNEEAMDLFIRTGISIDAKNEKGQTALIIASEKGFPSIAGKLVTLNKELLKHADKAGNTALMTATKQGQEDIVKLLHEKGADLNAVSPSSEGAATALQAVLDVPALKEEHMRVIQYLLQQGADAKEKNTEGQFPLLFAASHGHTDAAKALIEHGAGVNETDKNGLFSLQSAACKGYPWFVGLLADKGANMRMTLPDGHTPLMCAAEAGHADTVRVLLEKGAPVNAMTAGNSTALNEAVKKGNTDVVKLLLAQGADPAHGYIPDSFMNLKGRVLSIKAKKNKISDLLERIAKTASQDAYTVNFDLNMERKITFTSKGPWNKVLNELATRSDLLLIVKDNVVTVLSYDPAAIKHNAM